MLCRLSHIRTFCFLFVGLFISAGVKGHEMKGVFNPPLHHLRKLTQLKTGDPLVDWKSARTWTASDGRKLKAKIISAQGSTANFLLQNGKESTIPHERLSKKDQQFIAEWSEISAYFDTGYQKVSNLTGKVEAEIRDGAFAKDGKIHETRNFRFECDQDLSAVVVKDFSRLFEATYLAVKSLPLGLEAAEPKGKKFLVKLYAEKRDYLAAGGLEDSAGIYLLSDRVILVPLSSLGVTPGPRGFRKTANYDPGTLIHETVHAVTHQWLNIVPIWFAEGLAEYVAAMPYRDGALNFKGLDEGLRQRVAKKFGGDAKRFDLVSPAELVALDDRVFMDQPEVLSEPIVLDRIRPFQIQLTRNGEEPESEETPDPGAKPDAPMVPEKPAKEGPMITPPKGINIGSGIPRPPQQYDPVVVRRYVSSMLLVDHLLRSGQSEGLRKYLFSFLHNTWDNITYLGAYRTSHKSHIGKLQGQSKEVEQILKEFNLKIKAYNEQIDRYNSGEIETVPKKPADPVAPNAIPVPDILANPRSADDLSRKAFRQNAADGVLTFPAMLAIPE